MDSAGLPPKTGHRATATVLESKIFRDGAIYLYRRAEYKKPTWYIRLKIPGAKGYVWKSSGSTDEYVAYKVAEDLYNQSLVKVLSGAKLNSKRISDALNAYISQHERDQQRLSIHYKILFAKRLIPIFKSRTFDELDTALVSEVLDKLDQNSKRKALSPNTIKRLLADLRHFLNWAIEQGYADTLPKFPKIRDDQNRRPHFDNADWSALTRYMGTFVRKAHGSVRRDRMLLVNHVLILANTGIRVGEARNLKWRDIRPITTPDETETVAMVVKGKTGMREVVARTSDVKKWFNSILTERKTDLGEEDSDLRNAKAVPPDTFIFCGRDGIPIGSFKKSFATLLKDAGVEFDTFGNKRTLYSLRHTYATFRLHEGVNQYALARNMGTSVAMLEQFYGHTSNITSADELMKTSTRKVSKSSNQRETKDALGWLST
ncbi:tyrosine-type recombinase/integrase [Sphingorhabdus sp.]|jgi:integrase|uniref:tyrosine-type recombinase/integrase n=1 Tax=Sphingorhabdus sp. TaxID=1902408 RepID=UPI0037C7A6FF